MHKTTHRKNRTSDYDLYGDLANIKSVLAEATRDVKGRAGEMLTQSFEDLRDKSVDLQKNVGHYVEKKPFKSLGIAALFGAVIGYLIHK